MKDSQFTYQLSYEQLNKLVCASAEASGYLGASDSQIAKKLGLALAEAAKVLLPPTEAEAADYATRAELLALIDILAKPVQDGGEGMADNAESPLMKLRAAILAPGRREGKRL